METYGVTTPERSSQPACGQKVFTLAHANRSLHLVSRIVADIVKQHKKVGLLEEKCQILRSLDSGNTLEKTQHQFETELARLNELQDELAGIGCQLKDLRRGIVDFFSIHEGRPIEFCWRLNEKQINHWHEVDAGFRGRQSIDDEFLARLPQTHKCSS